MDQLLGPLMDDLRTCLAAELATAGGDASCASMIVGGQAALPDWCSCGGRSGCGMSWVRLDRLYPSAERFPAVDATTRAGCAGVLAAVLEVGVYRCAPVPSRAGDPPSPAEQTRAALTAADDALAMYRAIRCCEAVTSRPHLIGTYTPRDGGDCAGGVWTVTVQLRRRS